jgi:2-oxoglutaroyl-CoA hydrolase
VNDYDSFRVETDGDVATITLDVPGKLNRVSMAARAQLAAVFDELGADESVRFVVLTGEGEAFTAGGDIAGFLEVEPEAVSRLHWNVAAPERCPKPVIAKLRGYAFGVGFELALACDFRLAADDVELALPEVKLGMIPGSGGTQRLVRLVGLGRAKDIVLRGRRVGAEEALALGLVSEVVPAGDLDAAVERLLAELRELSPLALATAKRILNLGENVSLHDGFRLEGVEYALLRTSHDFREGVEAFVEKRKSRFEGR